MGSDADSRLIVSEQNCRIHSRNPQRNGKLLGVGNQTVTVCSNRRIQCIFLS